ncbi:MAG: 50S ribosomal protein L31 [Kistimonas sp.]|nr:50S ribosomal protein L31 [Kistimonas sp.]
MKKDIHPRYETMTASCSCGNKILVRSTLCKDMALDVCAKCHPFYTGTQKVIDSGGRIERFNKRFAGMSTRKGKPDAA